MIVKEYKDAIFAPSPNIQGLARELGDAHAKAILTVILIDLIKFFNLGKSMNDEQVAQTVVLIQEEFYMLKPEDFKLCFNNVKKGLYGDVYDRIDGQVIMKWLDKYTIGRMNYSADLQIQRHNEIKAGMHSERQRHDEDRRQKDREIHNQHVQHYIKNLKDNGK